MEDSSNRDPDDFVESLLGINVVTDSSSLEFLKGSTVDYEVELIRSAFVVKDNPQAENACGCGSSFAVKNFAANNK